MAIDETLEEFEKEFNGLPKCIYKISVENESSFVSRHNQQLELCKQCDGYGVYPNNQICRIYVENLKYKMKRKKR